MTDATDDQRVKDLVLLRRVRDRIDREYAEPLDVEALARGVRVVLREEGVVNGDVHDGHARCGSVDRASRFLTGLVTFLATHGAIPSEGCGPSRR